MIGPAPSIIVIDDFLPLTLVASLLSLAVTSEQDFVPSTVGVDQEAQHNSAIRSSLKNPDGLGVMEAAFIQAIVDSQEEIFEALGISSFEVSRIETELIAHSDRCFYRRHLDTFTGERRSKLASDRIISAVYYFYHEPKAFCGGELAVYNFGSDEVAQLIQPRCNRLVAFPSFALHEVMPILCPSNRFADSRFSVNCWLHRAGRGPLPMNESGRNIL